MGQPIGAVDRLPTVKPLRPQPAFVDDIGGPPADADDPPVLDADIASAAVRAKVQTAWTQRSGSSIVRSSIRTGHSAFS